jgi:hypothetical protein
LSRTTNRKQSYDTRHYDDGYHVTEMEKWRDEGAASLRREERRQVARKRFNLPAPVELPRT